MEIYLTDLKGIGLLVLNLWTVYIFAQKPRWRTLSNMRI